MANTSTIYRNAQKHFNEVRKRLSRTEARAAYAYDNEAFSRKNNLQDLADRVLDLRRYEQEVASLQAEYDLAETDLKTAEQVKAG